MVEKVPTKKRSSKSGPGFYDISKARNKKVTSKKVHEEGRIKKQKTESTTKRIVKCPYCGRPATYIPQYKRHYCYYCKKYVPLTQQRTTRETVTKKAKMSMPKPAGTRRNIGGQTSRASVRTSAQKSARKTTGIRTNPATSKSAIARKPSIGSKKAYNPAKTSKTPQAIPQRKPKFPASTQRATREKTMPVKKESKKEDEGFFGKIKKKLMK